MVTTTNRGSAAILGSFAFVSFVSLQIASAQALPPSAPLNQALATTAAVPAGAQGAQTAKGELKSVDVVKRSLTLAVESGASQTFLYTDTTTVTGAQGGPEGLATISGRQVTVEYNVKGADRIATSIEVAAK